MGGGIRANAKGKKDEDSKIKHVADGDDVKKLGIDARRGGVPGERVSCGENAESNHEDGEAETERAKAAVDVNAMCGDESSLRHEQQNPTRKNSTVEMKDVGRQVRAENTSEVVRVGEPDEDGDEDEERHRGKE